MEDLSQYIPETNRSWIKEMSDRLGEEFIVQYYNRVFVRMVNMKHQESLYVLEEVAPENYELFIKCAYTCISELASYGMSDYHLENNATVVYRS